MPGGYYFLLLQGKLFIHFSVFFQIHFGIMYIWPIYHCFDQRIWFTIIFFLSKTAAFCSKFEFSLLNCHIFSPSSCYHDQNYGNVLHLFWWNIMTWSFVLVYQFSFDMPHHKTWLFKKFIFELEAFPHTSKINSTSVRQLKPRKKVAVS